MSRLRNPPGNHLWVPTALPAASRVAGSGAAVLSSSTEFGPLLSPFSCQPCSMNPGFFHFKLQFLLLRPSRDFYKLPTHNSYSIVHSKKPFMGEKAFALFPLPPAEKKQGLRWPLLVPESLPTWPECGQTNTRMKGEHALSRGRQSDFWAGDQSWPQDGTVYVAC